MILLYALQQAGNSFPGHKCEIYNSIKSTCRRWAQIIKGKGPALLPKIYVDTSKPFGNPFHEKIMASTRKLTSTFGLSSGLANQLSSCICDRKWKSSWLVLTPEKHSWYTIHRILWKGKSCPQNESPPQVESPTIWLKNNLYELTEADKEVLETSDAWLTLLAPGFLGV